MDKPLRSVGIIIILILAVSGTGYFAVKKIAQNPCNLPKTWSIGTIDRRFTISKDMVQAYAAQAAKTWNDAYAPNPLLSYLAQGGDISINFVYDERQRTTIQNEKLKRSIEEDKDQLDDLKQTLDSLKSEYTTLGQTIDARTKAYTEHLATHNSEAGYWNTQGGAPNAEYQRLQREAAALETERAAINRDIARYNTLGLAIQNYGKSHNQVVSTINQKIETLNETALREFEEGTYDPSTNTITIYEYSDDTSLKRVLTHELGHAIGLQHVDDKQAIMYAVNEGTNLTLTEADKKELLRICRERTPEAMLEKLKATRDGIFHHAESSLLGTAVPAQ